MRTQEGWLTTVIDTSTEANKIGLEELARALHAEAKRSNPFYKAAKADRDRYEKEMAAKAAEKASQPVNTSKDTRAGAGRDPLAQATVLFSGCKGRPATVLAKLNSCGISTCELVGPVGRAPQWAWTQASPL